MEYIYCIVDLDPIQIRFEFTNNIIDTSDISRWTRWSQIFKWGAKINSFLGIKIKNSFQYRHIFIFSENI
jgi:hypothetical protein